MRKNKFKLEDIKVVGNKGVKNHYEIPENFIGIPKFIAVIVFATLILSVILMGIFISQKQGENKDSFKKFIEAGQAGTYHGVTMSPLVDLNTNKHNGQWIVEITDKQEKWKKKEGE